MKKILFILMAIVATANMALAQDAKKGSKKVEKRTAADATVQQPDRKLKKDGTPDMRYKGNKEVKPASGPLKKDGTPDMRHKANRDAAGKK